MGHTDITYYLLINVLILCSLGPLLILSPSTILNIWHTNGNSYDSQVLLAGWGASTLTLGLVCLFMLRSNQYLSKKIVAMALFCGYSIFTWGSYLMISSSRSAWNPTVLKIQMTVGGLMAAASFFYGFVNKAPTF